MKLQIKKLRKKDLPILKKHWDVYGPFLERYNSMFSGKSLFLIIWKNNKPIGHGKLILRANPIIEDMYLDKVARSKGIGSMLLKRLELYAKRRKYKRVYLYVESKNKKAEKFYINNSYKLTGKIKNKEKEFIKILS